MDFSHALVQLKAGEEIYRSNEYSLILIKDVIKMKFGEDSNAYHYNPTQQDLLSNDWEIKTFKPTQEIKLFKHKKQNETVSTTELEDDLENEEIL